MHGDHIRERGHRYLLLLGVPHLQSTGQSENPTPGAEHSGIRSREPTFKPIDADNINAHPFCRLNQGMGVRIGTGDDGYVTTPHLPLHV